MFSIRPGMEAEYDRRHAEVWPELVATLSAAGIRNYTLFRRGTCVIAYCECDPDPATAFARVHDSAVNQRWAASFEEIIDRSAGADLTASGAVTEVWHLD